MRLTAFRQLWSRFAKALVAVVAGNAIYFLAVMPHLPLRAQHQPNRIDLGLVIDFWVCLAVWGIVEVVARSVRKG